jgi:hypothetical protein
MQLHLPFPIFIFHFSMLAQDEKWADWGYRAVHEMVVATKKLAESYYGKPIYSGFERGSELNWNFMIEKEPFSANTND